MKYLVLVYVVLYSLFTKGYMSTRITPCGGHTMGDNVALSYRRVVECGSVMNPVFLNTGIWTIILSGWGHHEYMYVWNNVLRVYSLMNKPMYYYSVDHVSSRGCKEEMITALSMGMTVICMD